MRLRTMRDFHLLEFRFLSPNLFSSFRLIKSDFFHFFPLPPAPPSVFSKGSLIL